MASPHASFLESVGFRMTNTCACGGTRTETWQRNGPLTILEVKPVKGRFEIRTLRPRVSGTLAGLEVTIRKHIATAPPAAREGSPWSFPEATKLNLSAPVPKHRCKNC